MRERLSDLRTEIEALLSQARLSLPMISHPRLNAANERFTEATAYALGTGGKRVRPVLLLAIARMLGGQTVPSAKAAAAALEWIHTYSLIHDDLPCMDNDDERRGKPTLHRKFDEATALLVGDALLTDAFRMLALMEPAELSRRLCLVLSRAAGSQGMVLGQVLDLALVGPEQVGGLTSDHLNQIHLLKTGQLFSAAVEMGFLCGVGSHAELIPFGPFAALADTAKEVGLRLGLAFQMVDDVLDEDGIVEVLGLVRAKTLATESSQVALGAWNRWREQLTAAGYPPNDELFVELSQWFETLVSRTS